MIHNAGRYCVLRQHGWRTPLAERCNWRAHGAGQLADRAINRGGDRRDKVVRAARKLDEIKTKLTTERTPAARARTKPSSTVDIGLGVGSET